MSKPHVGEERQARRNGGPGLLERAFAPERRAEADVDDRQQAARERLAERNHARPLPQRHQDPARAAARSAMDQVKRGRERARGDEDDDAVGRRGRRDGEREGRRPGPDPMLDDTQQCEEPDAHHARERARDQHERGQPERALAVPREAACPGARCRPPGDHARCADPIKGASADQA